VAARKLPMTTPYVFLDRDGTINYDSRAYIKSWEEFAFLPGSLDAICELNAHGFAVVVITNQSAVNRRMITVAELEHIHANLKAAVTAAGGHIAGIFYCPHRPDEGCRCRKPEPGLVRRAQRIHGIELARSIFIGDSVKDMQCAHNAGCGRCILVRSGLDPKAEAEVRRRAIGVDRVTADLAEAARWLVRNIPR
jgi:D-glycero-D-manno-heptose 1,7-bisphosphate phosphatase